MTRHIVLPNWDEEPQIKEFYANYVSSKSASSTAPQYRLTLSRWITFLCERWDCTPEQIDYAKATHVRFGDSHYFEPIRTQVVMDFLSTLESTPSVYQVAHKVLRVYFTWLVDSGTLAVNPVPPVNYGSSQRRKKPGLTLSEICDLIAAINQNGSVEVKTPLMVQFAGGFRVGEVCALRICDIQKDPDGKWSVPVRREAMKGHGQGIVPLPDEVEQLFGNYLIWRRKHNFRYSDHLFLRVNGKPWTTSQLNEELQLLGALLPGLRAISTHDLRRAHATVMAENNVSPEIERQLLRQADAQTGFGYVRTPEYVNEVSYADIAKMQIVQLTNAFAAQQGGANI